MSRQLQLFARAAECECLMRVASDPVRRQNLKRLRDMWIVLASESRWLSRKALTEEIAAIDQIQSAVQDARHRRPH